MKSTETTTNMKKIMCEPQNVTHTSLPNHQVGYNRKSFFTRCTVLMLFPLSLAVTRIE